MDVDGRILCQFNIHFDLSCLCIGLHMNAPVLHMYMIRLRQPHMAIDATTTIPTTIRLVGVINPHGNDIITLLQVFRDVVLKTRITIRTMPYLLSVDIDGRVHIDTIKLNKVTIAWYCLTVKREVFTIPSDTARKCTTTCATGITSIEVALYRPVVRQIEYTPMGIVIRRSGHL